jgi:thymidylate synthase
MDQVEELLSRETYPLPTLAINPDVDNLFDFVYDDFELLNYQSHAPISALVAV